MCEQDKMTTMEGDNALEDSHCARKQERSEDLDLFVSALKDVLPSIDSDGFESSDYNDVNSKHRKKPRHNNRRSPSKQNVPVEIVLTTDSDDDSSVPYISDDDERSICVQDLYVSETEEEPIPDFQSTVDALGKLSISESIGSLPRSRAGASFLPYSPRQRRGSPASKRVIVGKPRSKSGEDLPHLPVLVREYRSFAQSSKSDSEISMMRSSMLDQSPRKPRRSLRIE